MFNNTDKMLEWHCEDCGEAIAFPKTEIDFHSAWGLLKREGWMAFKRGRDWYHCCPDCKVKAAKGALDRVQA
jgi:hypothetical protein